MNLQRYDKKRHGIVHFFCVVFACCLVPHLLVCQSFVAVGHHDALGGCENLKDSLSVLRQTCGADGEEGRHYPPLLLVFCRLRFHGDC